MSDRHQFILRPLKKDYPLIFVRNQVLTVGRSETCDYTINNQFLSFVHASLLKKDDVLIATDLDSTNGIYVNDKQVTLGELKQGDILRFGSVRYAIEYTELKAAHPHLPENTETQKILKDEGVIQKLTRLEGKTPEIPTPEGEEKSYDATSIIQLDDLEELQSTPNQEQTIVGLFPEFEFSEFIFEEELTGNAFDFENREACLEITSLFGSCIHEVDYFRQSEKQLIFTTEIESDDKVALPIIGLREELKIAEAMDDGRFRLLKTDFFDYKVYTESGVKTDCFLTADSYELEKNDLVVISNDTLNVYLKHTDSPPKTVPVKYFDRDKLLFILFSIFSFIWIAFVALMLFFEPPKKDLEDPEKIIKKIDRILYKKKIVKPLKPKEDEEELSDKPEKENTVVDNKPKKNDVVEDEPKAEEAEGTPAEEEAEEETSVDSKDKVKDRVVAPSPPAPAPEPVKKPTPVKAPKVTKKVVRTSLKAKKVIPPATKIKSLTSKYSQALGNLTSNTSGSTKSKKLRKNITQTNSATGKKDISFMSNQKRKSNILKGKKIGDFGSGKVTTGSSGKVIGLKNSVGRKTVILGMLDPRDIQNVLRQHLPRFAYCYDRELERKNKRFSTTIDLKFTIYANGRAKKPSFTSKSITFSSKAIRCFRRVMSTIQFPKPRGGGIVKVRQPINLEPK